MQKEPLVERQPPGGVTFVAATALECKALRREMPVARIVQTGIALEGARDGFGTIVVSCGLAGGLRPDLPTGTVLIPREVRRPGGGLLRCDAEMVEALAERARELGVAPLFDPLLTAQTIVHGNARAQWAAKGYAGVDMETGLIDALRVCAVRVILDTPVRELSADWRNPTTAMLKPWNWPQAWWLAREAPRAAALAARIAAGAQGIGAELRITRQ
ncbi:MAG: hypothetical protein JO113_03885 [Candidatus Eremiobacteraeota bacterium]|nr:hypothetical protein [Candidatus Eremiobacteraeota bacterium]